MVIKKKLFVGLFILCLGCNNEVKKKAESRTDLSSFNIIKKNRSVFFDTNSSSKELLSLQNGLNLYCKTIIINEIRFFPDFSKAYIIEFGRDSAMFQIVKYYNTNKFPIHKDSIINGKIKRISERTTNDLEYIFNQTYFWNLNNYDNDNLGCCDCNYYYLESTRDSTNFPNKNYNSFFTVGIRGSFIEFLEKIKNLENNELTF